MADVRVRFAPSPTGPPHVGTIHTGLFNWLYAKHTGGKFILRIEDTDREREVPGAYEQILEGLRWLGLDWDEGPEVGGESGPYIQSQRTYLYKPMADELIAKGHAYRCWCSKERLDRVREIQRKQNLPTGYDRHCLRLSEADIEKNIAEGLPYVVRLKVPREGKTGWDDVIRGWTEFENKLIDDQVLLKADGMPTYHLANVVDDHLMGVTHVVRGEDWISSTPKHLMLYNAFGWVPPSFSHVSLLLGQDKSKLSKRHGTTNFMTFIEEGYLPEALFNFLALLGWSPGDDQEIMSKDEIITKFDIKDCLKSGAVFDYEKLKWMNGHYLREMDLDDLCRRCLPYLQKAKLVDENPSEQTMKYIKQVIALEQERIKLLSEVAPATDYFFMDKPTIDEPAWAKWMHKEYVTELLKLELEHFQQLEDWSHDPIQEVINKTAEALGISRGNVIHPTRVALSGRTAGPGLFDLIAVLGKDRVLKRLRATQEMLG